jgi:hypothetical protein
MFAKGLIEKGRAATPQVTKALIGMLLRGDSFASDDDTPEVEIELPGDEESYEECAECAGCGAVSDEAGSDPMPWTEVAKKIADGDDRLQMAVEDGIVKPAECPACRGQGVVFSE